ncbi:MAG: hypothetical protein ACRDT0_17040 [Pseudonocardiaceae bacterium]
MAQHVVAGQLGDRGQQRRGLEAVDVEELLHQLVARRQVGLGLGVERAAWPRVEGGEQRADHCEEAERFVVGEGGRDVLQEIGPVRLAPPLGGLGLGRPSLCQLVMLLPVRSLGHPGRLDPAGPPARRLGSCASAYLRDIDGPL